MINSSVSTNQNARGCRSIWCIVGIYNSVTRVYESSYRMTNEEQNGKVVFDEFRTIHSVFHLNAQCSRDESK